MECVNDLNITSGVFNNKGYAHIQGTYNNNATTNLGINSLLRVNNYNNDNSGIINGTSDAHDLSEYPRILIHENSQNNGFIYGKNLVFDKTIVSNPSNINFGFDAVLNPENISSTILYAIKGNPLGTGIPIKDCSMIDKFYSVLSLEATQENICPGTCITITPHLSLLQNSGQLAYYEMQTLTNFLWQPGNQTSPTIVVCPTTDQVYNFSTEYLGCQYTGQIQINVTNLSVNVGPSIYPPIGGPNYQLNPTIGGGVPPYSCTWSSNQASFSSNICNPVYTPSSSDLLTLTVVDANGCSGSGTLFVKFPNDQYAELKKTKMEHII